MNLDMELKRYAFAFTNFAINNIEEKWLEGTNSIILFGSVAQNRASEDSDVDIFFDVAMPKSRINELRRVLLKIKEEFILTSEALKFKSKRIYNEINFTIGNLAEWPEMKKSISAGGLIIYGKYSGVFHRGDIRHYMIFFWESIGRNRGAFLNKLYGYTVKKKRYKGFLDGCGIKIGKSAVLIPAERKDAFITILQKYDVEYKLLEVYME